MRKMNIDPGAALSAGDFTQMREDAMLGALAEDAATEEERINVDGVPGEFIDHYTNKPVIAEAIRDADRQQFEGRVLPQFRDFRFVTTPCREIELVCALGELSNARELFRPGRLDVDLQVQCGEKVCKSD